MAMTDQTRVISMLKSILNGTPAWPTIPAAWKMKLGSTAPTNTTTMTEIASGGGYVTGGQAFTSATVSIANPVFPASALSWPNSSGSAWSIVGLEVVDGAPLRWLFGSWTGQPVAVANGNTFQVAASAVTADATGW